MVEKGTNWCLDLSFEAERDEQLLLTALQRNTQKVFSGGSLILARKYSGPKIAVLHLNCIEKQEFAWNIFQITTRQ